MNYVLIFCNSTAGRLIYAHSHYNMCAGGGYMYQISNEKFGLFVTELRKEKNLTQKDLAEKLYVSDKTVSKWERGLSMPNVVLLIPIADILDVTVTELLRGEKIDTQKNIDKKVDEQIAVIRANVRSAFLRVCFSAESNSTYNSRKKFQCPLSQRAHFFEKIIDSNY